MDSERGWITGSKDICLPTHKTYPLLGLLPLSEYADCVIYYQHEVCEVIISTGERKNLNMHMHCNVCVPTCSTIKCVIVALK